MNRSSRLLIALFAGFALAGSAVAQGRHDDRPHGYDKTKAKASATATQEVTAPAGAGGRHDEKPHGAVKKSAPAKAATPPATAPADTAAAGNSSPAK